jgi:ATP-dependent exoDNAse (exonuclease V) alpha subunit
VEQYHHGVSTQEVEFTSRQAPGTTPNPISVGPGFDSGDPLVLEALVNRLIAGERIFVTGAAGTGKTFLVKLIARTLAERRRTVYVTASTGIAASLLFDEIGQQGSLYVKGPSTLHSAAMLPFSEDEDQKDLVQVGRRKLSTSDVVIIDEISMLDKLTFSRFLKRLQRGRRTGLLAVGDFHQLPPVREVENGEPDFAFRSKSFGRFKLLELTNVYRQTNAAFVTFLEGLRHGECDRQFLARIPEDFDLRYPVLFGTRREAAIHNDRQMAALHTPPFMCECAVTVGKREKALKWFSNYARAVQRLEIKQGMRVLCVQNMPCSMVQGGVLVNGDLGTIERVSEEQWEEHGPEWVDVSFDRVGSIRIRRYPFQKKVNDGSQRIIFEVQQFPFIPAYGLTVHKAQGMTLEVVNIDGNKVNFAAGQVYVAVSRCRHETGLRIQNSSMFEAFTRPSVDRYYNTAPRFGTPEG